METPKPGFMEIPKPKFERQEVVRIKNGETYGNRFVVEDYTYYFSPDVYVYHLVSPHAILHNVREETIELVE